jgi:GDP-L-fucose synthase
VITRTHAELDLTDAHATQCAFFEAETPEYVFLAAAKVGGIVSQQAAIPPSSSTTTWPSRPTSSTARGAARREALLFLGRSCIYPKAAPQPMRE